MSLGLLAAQNAQADIIGSPILLSSIAGGPQVMTVGGLQFTFAVCTGSLCSSSNVEIVGVPASASTGPGGGIVIQYADGTSPFISAAASDFSLQWLVSVVSGTNITGVTSSGTGNAGTGTASFGTTVALPPNYTSGPATITVPVNASPEAVTLAFMQPSLAVTNDFNVTGNGDITHANIFVSQVPEPATVALLLSGIVALGVRRRRLA